MRTIEDLAELSVARACGFAAIGMITFVTGMMGEPSRAFLGGGIVALLTCFVLVLKATWALQRPYKRTEVWIMMRPAERPQAEVAQRIIGTTLREVYLRFALRSATLAGAMLVASIILGLMPRAGA